MIFLITYIGNNHINIFLNIENNCLVIEFNGSFNLFEDCTDKY